MCDAVEQAPHLDIHTEFLLKFAGQALLKRFSRLTFAARKFPQPAEMRSGVTLSDEQFTGTEDESSTDFDKIGVSQEWPF